MEEIVEIRHTRVVAVDRQQVLGQVVGADREEIDLARQFAGLINGCRDLDHHADRRQWHIGTLVTHLAPGAVDQVQRLFQLLRAGNHRQQDAQVVQTLAGLEHGAGLHQEDFRVIEGHANTAPTQERVLFLDREVGQRLVAADIQGAHGHRQRVEGLQLLAIGGQLLLLAGKALVDHERHFGTVQADALGAALLGTCNIGEQAGVDPQRHTVAVEGLAGQRAQSVEPFGELALLLDHLGVLLAQQLAGVGEDFAVIAIDDQLDAVDLRVRQVDHTHDRGNAHGTGENRHVGVARAGHRDQTDQLAFRHLAEHRRRQLLADQDGVIRIDQRGLAFFLQVGEQAPTEVAHIGGALAQVCVIHQLETIDVVEHHLAQGALRPLTGTNDLAHLVTQCGVLEHHQVDVEQRALFLA